VATPTNKVNTARPPQPTSARSAAASDGYIVILEGGSHPCARATWAAAQLHSSHGLPGSCLPGDNPPALWVVLTEAAVRTLAGDGDVMREQLARVLELAELPHVSVRLIPFSSGPHASMGVPFFILRLPEPDGGQVVYLEDQWSADYLDKPKQTSAYSVLFDRLCTAALDEQGTRTAIEEVMKELP
jgi:hypothetical protein